MPQIGAMLVRPPAHEHDKHNDAASVIITRMVRAGSVCLHKDWQRVSGSSAGCFLDLPIWAVMQGGRNRRLAKDFERTIESATAWLYLASIQLMTRRIART